MKELEKRIISSLIIIPIAIFFIFEGSFYFIFFLSFFFLATSYEWIKMNKVNFIKIIGIFYLFFAFFLAYLLRENFSLGIFILVLIICIFTDLGGYIFGKIFKGPKLTKISPKKTFSGVLGGYLLSIVILSIYSKIIFNPLQKDELTFGIFIIILLISTISQLGDIIISYFKRLSKIKNTGKIIPGHGGLLDRVDGMIFAFPFSYLIFKINIFQYF